MSARAAARAILSVLPLDSFVDKPASRMEIVAFILSLVLCWNEYFFAALLTSTDAKTLPVMVANQTGSQGVNWWSMPALSTTAIAPIVPMGVFVEGNGSAQHRNHQRLVHWEHIS